MAVLSYPLQPIGIVESCFCEKFGIPRQPGLVAAAQGRLRLLPPFDHADTVRGIEQFSHLWLTFVFHQTAEQGWKPLIRPPKLGGNARVGVFASRSTFRPNPIGLSVVELLEVDTTSGVCLTIGGLDLLDGTPVLDIKPYLPYADSLPQATGGYAPPAQRFIEQVSWTTQAQQALQQLSPDPSQDHALITALLQQDPRPGYQHTESERIYGMQLKVGNVRWRVLPQGAEVIDIEPPPLRLG